MNGRGGRAGEGDRRGSGAGERVSGREGAGSAGPEHGLVDHLKARAFEAMKDRVKVRDCCVVCLMSHGA